MDGNLSINSDSTSESESDLFSTSDTSSIFSTVYDTDDELDPQPIPANFLPHPNQPSQPGQPILLDVDVNIETETPSRLPLCIMLNARSLYNKRNNFRTLLHQIAPDIAITSETWERRSRNLHELLSPSQYKCISYARRSRPGGGCAIFFNENRFLVEKLDVLPPDGVEATWAVFTPKNSDSSSYRVNRILVGSIYVSPKSRHKAETINHIIETLHYARSLYENDIHFLFGGDFNRLDIGEILNSYGALKQFVSTPTRKNALLEIILTDLHPFFHPPTTIAPLQVDMDKDGSDSDHNVVVMAPQTNSQYKVDRVRKTKLIRPTPQSKIDDFGKEITSHTWDDVVEAASVDEKVDCFHSYILQLLNKHFPEKQVNMSNLDKKWMTPNLKLLHRKMQREFFKNRKSKKWKNLKSAFRRQKRKSIKMYFSNFVTELKETNPGKWYGMAKKIGAVDQMSQGNIQVEALVGLNNKESAQAIANHFASISNQYKPVDLTQLPSYLPAPPPPQVDEYQVYLKLRRQKKTKTTLPIDIPENLKKEFSPELALPLANIINASLNQQRFPKAWKFEWVTPVPKVSSPKVLKDLRKISCTSDFSKICEDFLKEFILEDISENLDVGQFGGQRGTGTDHMIVCLVNRVLQLLDTYRDHTAVIAACIDWAAAFDRQDPTLSIKSFIEIGVRPSLIPILISYLDDRKMQVKFNGELSDILTLIGGGPQGTLIGQIMYLVQTNNNADCVNSDDRFKYIDDLSILQIVCLAGLVQQYNFFEHVPSDVGTDQVYLPPETFKTQEHLNEISRWTNANLMELNASKSNYMVFTRTRTDFMTRLTLNDEKLDQVKVTKLLGVWISEDLSWTRNTEEISRKCFSRLSLITKLKYVGVSIEDLLDIYVLFIRSCAEYCCVAFHSSLTVEQSNSLETIQKVCLRVILGENYVSYDAALEMTGLKTLYNRREERCLSFSLKCLKHPIHKKLFPVNPTVNGNADYLREREPFVVNFAHTNAYKISTIPYCQRLLNSHFSEKVRTRK